MDGISGFDMSAGRIDHHAYIAIALGGICKQLPADPLRNFHIDLTENQDRARFEQRHLYRRHRLIGPHALVFSFFLLRVVVIEPCRREGCHSLCPDLVVKEIEFSGRSSAELITRGHDPAKMREALQRSWPK